MRFVHLAAIVIMLWLGAVSAQAAAKKINPNDPVDPKVAQPVFERIFGDYARLDPAKIKMIVEEAQKSAPGQRGRRSGPRPAQTAAARRTPAPTPLGGSPAQEGSTPTDRQGKRWYYDTNNDGRPDEVWFIDVQARAPEAAKPILVRVIDQGGDLVQGGEPDQTNDLFIVDWHADGIVDCVLEYQDLNGDGGAERQIMYWYGPTFSYFKGERLRALVYTNLSGNHAFVHMYGYKYDQPQGQWRTPFGAEQVFHSFVFDPDKNIWLNYWENPFGFYDHDRDGAPEEAIRYSGSEGTIDSYRHSFDAVNVSPQDGTGRHYDCSITAVPRGGQWDTNGKVGRGKSSLGFDLRYCEPMRLRGIPTQPCPQWDKLPTVGRGVVWARTMFTWIEDGNNSDPEDKNFNERWEGVITKRILTPEQQKIEDELKAKEGKEPPDKSREAINLNIRENSIFPRVGSPDCGEFNRRFEMVKNPAHPVAMYFHPVDQRIHIVGADNCWINIDTNRDGKSDMIYVMETNRDGIIDRWRIDVDGDGKFEETVKAGRGLQPRYFAYTWADLNARMSQVLPYVPQMLYAINVELAKALKQAGVADDPLAAQLENSMRCPNIPDKLAEKYVNSDESLRLWLDCLKDRRIVALRKELKNRGFWHDFDRGRARGHLNEMYAALVKLNGGSKQDPAKLYEEWKNKLCSVFKSQQVGYKFLNDKGNVMWESMTHGYRIYNGQFDLFAKYDPQLISRIKPNWGNYHREQKWGMDCFLLGSTAGLGGVTLYVNGKPYPVRNATEDEKPGDIHMTARLLEFTSDTVTIEYNAAGVGPKKAYNVTWHLTARGGHPESMNEVTVTGGQPGDKLQLGIEMMKLPPKETWLLDTGKGVMASRIFEGPEIGWVGLGLIFPSDLLINMAETPSSHMAVVKCEAGQPITYYTQCDWVRGRKYDFGPTAQDWFKEMQTLSDKIRNEE
ncbi:DUF4861 domain-containing protein [bacterium]|nr:DUF4861 domain-containing protein [bacterium]